MLPPAFPVLRRGEQFIHKLFVGIGRFIVQEIVELCFGGRQANQIQIDAPRQGELARILRVAESFRFQLLQ